ncbi:MAG TPA: methionyl-tRNA formyltransferase [bacterium]|nr:MAG: Methionyl-tRNA formyltransferase [Parcubacteria group bacterium ADurb.Bin192]HPN15072.1 methionyl-tRNA formyltransferase [bacterium]
MPYKIIFFGTSEFSTPSLQALIDDPRFEVTAVVTKPDQPVGRHQFLTKPPVKILAEKFNIPVYQFQKIKTPDTYQTLSDLQQRHGIDAYVIVSYGKIIPQNILDLPKRGVINVHGSLLPKHRGASCVQAAIASGDRQTGVTVMLLDAEMDHGDILAQAETEISEAETGGQLHDRLAQMGGELLTRALVDYFENKITPQPQDHALATYCKMLTREDGKIDWNKSALEICNLIRAYNPWPGTWFEWQGKRLKILKAAPVDLSKNLQAPNIGQLLQDRNRLLVLCGDQKFIEILELQPEGKKPMSGQTYLAGHKI